MSEYAERWVLSGYVSKYVVKSTLDAVSFLLFPFKFNTPFLQLSAFVKATWNKENAKQRRIP